jgi:tetratricopeptide (TPR) repeat protein
MIGSIVRPGWHGLAALSVAGFLWALPLAPAHGQAGVLPQGRPDMPGSTTVPEQKPPPKQQTLRERLRNLEILFGALKAAPDDASAKLVEGRIETLWLEAGGDTAELLMTRAKAAIEARDFDLALKLLDAVVKLKPDYVEGWNRRATVYFLKKDFGHAVGDLREVLLREPRHFGALAGLGMILHDVGDDKRALAAFRRALDVYPRLPRIPDLVKELTEKVEGRDI